MFINHLLQLCSCVAVKLNFRPYIWRSTSPNENFEYIYPQIYSISHNNKNTGGCVSFASFTLGSNIYSQEWVIENYYSYFSTKTYVVGTKRVYLNEMVLLSTHMFKLRCKKTISILDSKNLIIWAFVHKWCTTIGVAPITHVRNKNSNIQGMSPKWFSIP